ncbi:MAG: hypothetical protein F4X80_00850 [Chloroflexi bacterium]|nr:hypothetical protein [Chloroflexota bacterium]MYE31224.1 hypothetical protein [Chloroflexota bacterium]
MHGPPRDLLTRVPRRVLTALPLVAVAALLAVTIRSEAGPGPLAAATPTPDAVLKQQCVDGAAVGSGNDGLAGDCALLLAGKDTLRGAETLNWSAGLAIASWEGVTVSGSPGRVTQLHIDGWNSERQIGREILLRGTIPAAHGGLSKLERLVLSWNALTGTIPAELGSLPELNTLSLYSNRLTGAVPPELGGLTNLRVLELSRNRLSGGIPVELGKLSGLTSLWLHNNQLTGAVPASLADLCRGFRRVRDARSGERGLSSPMNNLRPVLASPASGTRQQSPSL